MPKISPSGSESRTPPAADPSPGAQPSGRSTPANASALTSSARTARKDIPRYRTPTATALVHDGDLGHLLVGRSDKHKDPVTGLPKLVFPGGKYSVDDMKDQQPFLSCIKRELQEEVDKELLQPMQIGIASDPTRDVRAKQLGEFAQKRDVLIADPSVSKEELASIGFNDPNSKAIVQVSFGNTDTIVTGTIANAQEFENTEELSGLHFFDVRNMDAGAASGFAAGHDVIALAYQKVLPQLEQPESDPAGHADLLTPYLVDFEATRQQLLGKRDQSRTQST